MRERPIIFSTPMVRAILDGHKTMTRRVYKSFGRFLYGQIGDHLWVRETFSDTYELGDYPGIPFYKATYLQDWKGNDPSPETWDIKWKPSIFMPRQLSRITIEITNVRVERLQEINGKDAVAEGCGLHIPDCDLLHFGGYKKAKDEFHALWDSINGKKYPWLSNPFVWVIEFKRLLPHD